MLDGDVADLYDWDRQALAEQGLFPPDDPGDFLAFAYPPFVALAYAPLALLPFRVAYAVHTLFMAGCVALAVRVLAPDLPRIGRYGAACLVFALAFHPTFRAVGGAQNSAISTLLFVASGALVARGMPVAGGFAAGLLLFKPQLAVPLVGLYLVERQPRALAGAALAGAALYGAGAAIAGFGWPRFWWTEGVLPFQGHDQDVNGPNCVGFIGFAEVLLGVGHPAALALGGGAAVATIAMLCTFWYTGTSVDRTERTALAAVGALMISPHAMFYDATLLFPALLVALDRDARLGPLIAALWALSHLHPAKAWLGFTPLFFVAAGTLAVAIHGVRHARRSAAVGTPHPA